MDSFSEIYYATRGNRDLRIECTSHLWVISAENEDFCETNQETTRFLNKKKPYRVCDTPTALTLKYRRPTKGYIPFNK